MKPLSTLGLMTGIFLMLLALGIWSASHQPPADNAWGVAQPQATLAHTGRAPVSGP